MVSVRTGYGGKEGLVGTEKVQKVEELDEGDGLLPVRMCSEMTEDAVRGQSNASMKEKLLVSWIWRTILL